MNLDIQIVSQEFRQTILETVKIMVAAYHHLLISSSLQRKTEYTGA